MTIQGELPSSDRHLDSDPMAGWPGSTLLTTDVLICLSRDGNLPSPCLIPIPTLKR